MRLFLDKSEWVKIWKANPNNTIEHILPQNKGLDCWDEITDDEHSRYLNRLGNLTLLAPGLNSEAGNKCFKDKKLIYDRTNLIALEDLRGKNKWTLRSIEERTRKLLVFAKYQWEDLEF
jgi:hypothetical protein